ERLRETAEEFGLLLQLVNVSKDVYDDYTEENNVYLPAEWLEAEGVDQERVVHPENRESSARVVDRTADYARSFLDDAQAYLETMP
ncbi:farnesyl-diphosphate farnesyltransferase, partial [Halorubrum sp. SS7]